jgi:predicted membrane protein
METLETNKQVKFHRYRNLNKSIAALVLVVAGCVILGHNLGMVSDYFFRIIISWPMLLIALGLTSFLKRNPLPGCFLLGTGIYFILPRIIGAESILLRNYWPIFLIILGLIILFRRHGNPWCEWQRHSRRHHAFSGGGPRRTEQVTDGFVTVDVSFGNSRHIVLDPVFRGANLESSFGMITLDLRRTSLEDPETYINVNCSFGGVEICVPSHWSLFSELENTFGSCEDKRYVAQEIDTEHKLIVRGDVSFGSLEIKN